MDWQVMDFAGHLSQKRWQQKYDVIMPDARGHGKSTVPNNDYQYEDLANDIEEFISILGLSSPIIIGHSMGGMTAALVVSRKQISLNA